MLDTEELETDEIFVEQMPYQPDADASHTAMGNALAKVALGAAISATLGAIAGALANRNITDKLNMTVKGVGSAVKGAAEGIN